MSCRVVRVPHQDAGNTAVHARGHEECHSVLGLGRLDIRNRAISGDRNRQGKQHDDPSKFQAIREKCHGHWGVRKAS